jgi:cephalosporin-C deacetylase-like acetyl esterase
VQKRLGLFQFTVLIGILALNALPLLAQDAEWIRHFDYDSKAELGIKEIGVEHRGGTAIYDITYASPKGGVVPAFLVVPTGKGPFAAIIWGHWYWPNSPARNRTEFLDEAVALAPAGAVSLLTDGPIARPGHVENNEPLNEQQFLDLVQQIVDMRRGLDLLLNRKDVDPKRIAYVGHSYNATVGAFLAGLDRRFKAFVLMAGGLSDEVALKTPEYQAYRQKTGPEKFDAFLKKYDWTDPGKYVAHAAPAFVFMQFATQERFITPERARQAEAIVSQPKRFKLYEAPHALNAEARRDRIAFLTEQLKLKALPAAAIANIPDLFQPPAQDK